ncbi:MAG: hypothetical protein HZB53_11080 [Chloroflexi bacterium]|nr:hypothetical protein [Chloroflexota bacterium]
MTTADNQCFIIMPLTTPGHSSTTYEDSAHFMHVLEHLFIPAVEKAGLVPIRPNSTGSDIIHAEIIRNLNTACLVLCDMSDGNPNVFFELGVRTALNKPIALVVDGYSTSPFDAVLINHQKYDGRMRAWELSQQIEALSRHLTASIENSKGVNQMWQIFGMRVQGKQAEPSNENKLDLIVSMMMEQRANRRAKVLKAYEVNMAAIQQEYEKNLFEATADRDAKALIIARNDRAARTKVAELKRDRDLLDDGM